MNSRALAGQVGEPLRPLPQRRTTLRRQQYATRALFGIAGFAAAAWASVVPFAKSRTGLDEGALGLLLLCLGAGSILTMPLVGALCARHGCRVVIWVASVMMVLTLPLLVTASTAPALGAVLFVFGAGLGAVDCAINIQAVIVEAASGQPMMSGFHGFYSVGGILGAAGVSSALSLGLSPLGGMLLASGLVLVTLWWVSAGLLPHGSPREGPAFAVPRGFVLLLGVLAFVMFLAEGAMLDWSAVFLTQERGLPSAQAGFGFACFALAMTAGRFCGDAIVRRLGPVRVVLGGSLLAASGVAMATLVPAWQLSLAGYALLGLGASNIVPVLFSAAGRQKAMSQAAAIPAIATLGYAGVLCGPAGIGFVAHHTSLPAAFLVVAGLLVVVGAAAPALRDR